MYWPVLHWVWEMPAFTDNLGSLSFTIEISGCIAAQFVEKKKVAVLLNMQKS